MSIFGELKRLKVFRAWVAYVIQAWLLALLLGLAPVEFFSLAHEERQTADRFHRRQGHLFTR